MLNTKWFLPQNRERIYLVGYLGDGGGGQIFPIGSNDSEIDAPVDRGNTCTITARYKASTSQGSYINELYKVPSAIVKRRIRRLTIIECERLQGFPDNWTKYGTQGDISDSQRYKMCGNAVTVDVVKAVAEKIKQINYATT